MNSELICIEKDYGVLYGIINPNSHVSSISSLSIIHNSRRKGLGSAIFYEFLYKAKKYSDLIIIEIHTHNHKAISFWEHHGFQYVGLLDQDYLEYMLTLKYEQ